mgnify:CR=1 FL=1
MTAFDRGWSVAKMPYDIGGDVFDQLYQGGKEGDLDTDYWPMSYDEALVYALMGSNVRDDANMRGGIPQIRVAPETEQMHHLNSDPETTMVGMARNLPHEIQSREKTAKDVEQLLADYEEDPDYYEEMRGFLDTSGGRFSTDERIAHIKEQLRRLRE